MEVFIADQQKELSKSGQPFLERDVEISSPLEGPVAGTHDE